MKNLRNQQKIYANAGRTGCDKYDLWARRWKLHYTTKSHANRSADSHSLLGLIDICFHFCYQQNTTPEHFSDNN